MEDRKAIAGIVNDFVGTLKRLMKTLAETFPNDAVVARTQKRLQLAASAAPTRVLMVSGGYLFKYREYIYSGDEEVWSQFIDGEKRSAFDSDVAAAENPEDRSEASHIIPLIQGIAKGLDRKGRQEYHGVVQSLLDLYLDYLVLTDKGK